MMTTHLRLPAKYKADFLQYQYLYNLPSLSITEFVDPKTEHHMMDVEWAEYSYFPLESAFRHTLAFIHRDTKKELGKLHEQVAFLNTLTQSQWDILV
jgi:hypothetical protein